MAFNLSGISVAADPLDDLFALSSYNKLVDYMEKNIGRLLSHIHSNIQKEDKYKQLENVLYRCIPEYNRDTKTITLQLDEYGFYMQSLSNIIYELIYLSSLTIEGIDLSQFRFTFDIDSDADIWEMRCSVMEYMGRHSMSYQDNNIHAGHFCQCIRGGDGTDTILKYDFTNYTAYLKRFVSYIDFNEKLDFAITSFAPPFAFKSTSDTYSLFPHTYAWTTSRIAKWIKDTRISNTIDDLLEWVKVVNNISHNLHEICIDKQSAYILVCICYNNRMLENHEVNSVVKYIHNGNASRIAWKYFYGFFEHWIFPKVNKNIITN